MPRRPGAKGGGKKASGNAASQAKSDSKKAGAGKTGGGNAETTGQPSVSGWGAGVPGIFAFGANSGGAGGENARARAEKGSRPLPPCLIP